jgi:hypothetical protein
MNDATLPPDLVLRPEVLREYHRRVLWVKGDRHQRYQFWRRINGGAQAQTWTDAGVCAIPVAVTRCRQQIAGWLQKLLAPFRGRQDQQAVRFPLPTGEWVEVVERSRLDALLAWTANHEGPLTPQRIAELWPGHDGCEQLGPHLFLVLGVKPRAGSPPLPSARESKAPPQLPTAPWAGGNGLEAAARPGG